MTNLHPLWFAIFPFLFIVEHNSSELTSEDLKTVFSALMVTILLTGLLWFLLNRIVKNTSKSALIVSLFLVLFFSYGHFINLIKNYWPDFIIANISIGHHKLLLFFWLVIFVSGVCVIVAREIRIGILANACNVFAISLMLISVVKIIHNMGGVAGNTAPFNSTSTFDTKSDDANEKLRDIYYVVLERYAGADTLLENYQHDNVNFLMDLESKGFFIAEKSRANYLKTGHSLASSLNMKYINYLSERSGSKNEWTPIYQLVRNHEVWRYLKNKGYMFIQIGGWWEATRSNPNADINLNFGESAEITNVILSTTLLYPILSKLNIGLGDWKTKHFKRENMRFQALRQIPEYRKATFTFAHMYITHDPYAFDENCEYVAEHEEKMLPIDDAYIAAIKCANKKIINTVEAILSQYNKNELPIIIIQGDEGPFPERYRGNQTGFDWKKEATETELKKKFSILNAYYLPGAKTNFLYPSISPVNSFRVVFNLFFNEEYDLLPDKSYVFKDSENIYDFFDVTDIVDHQ